jgi:hypothetical protein
MKAIFYFVYFSYFVFYSIVSLAQNQMLTLKPGPTNGKDISVWNNASFQTGNTNELEAYAWTNQGTPGFKRILIDFDWSQIPSNAIIVSATLSLFHNPSGPSMPGHSQQSGSNASVLQRIISPWNELTVTWNTQPSTTTQNQIQIPATTSSTQNFHINVTSLVTDILSDPSNSHGFLLKLVTEQYYRSLIFASSDHADSTLWPELNIEYRLSELPCITLKPGPVEGKDISVWNNASFQTGNTNELEAYAWTNQGAPGFKRILIDFDWSQIPANATIVSATLSLFHNPTGPSMPGHSQQSGSNASVLQRIISPWNELTVTWNTQPSTTTQNQIQIPATTSSTQNFQIDVTSLVTDIFSDPSNSHGFLLKLVTEQYYRSLIFASSDHADSTLWPQIEICWVMNADVLQLDNVEQTFSVFPNPTFDIVNIHYLHNDFEDYKLTIYTIEGQVVFSEHISSPNAIVDISGFRPGFYVCCFASPQQTQYKKILKL